MMSDCCIIGSAPYKCKIPDGVDLIVVNDEIVNYPNAKYFVTLDYALSAKIFDDFEFRRFKGCKVFILCLHGAVKDGYTVHDEKFNLEYNLAPFGMIIKSRKMEGISNGFKDFRNNGNSGLAAVQFALCMGYRNIHIYGIDMNSSEYERFFFMFEDSFGDVAKYYPEAKLINHGENSSFRRLVGYVEV
jgi:hypothetical protein